MYLCHNNQEIPENSGAIKVDNKIIDFVTKDEIGPKSGGSEIPLSLQNNLEVTTVSTMLNTNNYNNDNGNNNNFSTKQIDEQ